MNRRPSPWALRQLLARRRSTRVAPVKRRRREAKCEEYAARMRARRSAILVHGGCGEYSEETVAKKLRGCRMAAGLGYATLRDGGSVVDAVERAVNYMESNPDFNCGYGSVLNEFGDVEADACIVHGKEQKYGGVFVVKNILHPISLARKIMETGNSCLLAGGGAEEFARANRMLISRPGALVLPRTRALLAARGAAGATEAGTVGCCALDRNGELAAGTSTGGLNGKLAGRCGDTAAAGCGTYADDATGAVSATGHGESCVKMCLAYNILHEIGIGTHPFDAARKSLREILQRFKQTAGVIVLAKTGEIAVTMTASRMVWVAIRDGEMRYGTKPGEAVQVELDVADLPK